MKRFTALVFVGFVTLPMLAAQDASEWDKLGKETVRFLDSTAEEALALAKTKPADLVDKVLDLEGRYNKQIMDLSARRKKLTPEDEKSLQEKYGKEMEQAVKRLEDAKDELKKALPEEEPIEKIKERLEQNLQKASERLSKDKNDTGEETIKIQEEIKKDLDELRRRKDPNGGGGGGASGQSGSGQSGNGQSGNGQSGSGQNGNGQSGDGQTGKGNPKENKKNGDGTGDNQEDKKKDDPMGGNPKDDKKEKGKQDQKGNGNGGPNDKKAGNQGGGLGAKTEEGKLDNPDLKKGFWGQMADTKRTEMEIYAKDRFMRRYEDALRNYYRAIAETK